MKDQVIRLPDDKARPAVAAWRLRTELKRARRSALLTQDKAAESLEWSISKVVRIESGAVGISATDLRALLWLYGITDENRVDDFITVAREARMTPWWKKEFGDIASDRYLEYVEFEQTAAEIHNYEPQFVPGLLQTRDYAEAIAIDLSSDPIPDLVDRYVNFRMERQNLLRSDQAPNASFVMDESALRRQVGNQNIMSNQITHLIGLAEHTRLSIRILSFTGGLTYGMQTPFVLMRFPDEEDNSVLYFEEPRGNKTVFDDGEIRRYGHVFTQLLQMSLSERDTLEFLKGLNH